MEHFVTALDSRDRVIFEAGPYENATTAKHVADDWAGTDALSTFKAEELDEERALGAYYRLRNMHGVLINRALAYTKGRYDHQITYDTASLDLSL